MTSRLSACATCFGASDSAMAQGMNMGILALLAVIGGVLGGVAAFFGFLALRGNRLHPDLDSSADFDAELLDQESEERDELLPARSGAGTIPAGSLCGPQPHGVRHPAPCGGSPGVRAGGGSNRGPGRSRGWRHVD